MHRRMAVVLVLVVAFVALTVATATTEQSVEAHAQEALTSASSLGGNRARSGSGSGSKTGSGSGDGVYNGACCRICPNTFYAIPRVTPRPKMPPPRFVSKKTAREQRFAAVFDGRRDVQAESFTFIAFAEQLSTRGRSKGQAQAQSRNEARNGWDRVHPSRVSWTPDYDPVAPTGVYSNDPYQKVPIQVFTKESSEQAGMNCCNVCAIPGAGRLKYPNILKWGESAATDDFPDSPYDIPCCKLCSSGCFSNGMRQPPNVKIANAATEEAGTEDGFLFPMIEQEATTHATTTPPVPAVRNGAILSETEATTTTQTGVSANRKRAIKARGNWPKTMDPPGANLPTVQLQKSCEKDRGCCSVCYNHPMIYDHAPSGIW